MIVGRLCETAARKHRRLAQMPYNYFAKNAL
jgi:hypothetical protein